MCFVLGALEDDPAFCSGSSCCRGLIVADVWVFACWTGKLIRLFVISLFSLPHQVMRFPHLTALEKSQSSQTVVGVAAHEGGGWAHLIFKSIWNHFMILYKDTLFRWGRMFCWSSVGCINLFSLKHNNSGRQSCLGCANCLHVTEFHLRREFRGVFLSDRYRSVLKL